MKVKKGIACLLILLCAVMFASTAWAACPGDTHSFGSWRTKRSATCHRTGLQFKYCNKCDHWEKRELSKLKHEPDLWEITSEATCTKTGTQEAICLLCGDPIKKTIDMLEHAYGGMAVVKEPTCTMEGRGEYTCADCGRIKAESLDKLGHDWQTTSVSREPTCHAVGSGEKTCQRCGRTQTGRIDKLEHAWGEWTITQEPEGAKQGVRKRSCALCGDEKSERFYYEGTLYLNMEPSEEVIRLQVMLRDMGYYKGSIRSGQFGEMTGRAVGKFQTAIGLPETEVADAKTLEAIALEWEKQTGKSAEEIELPAQ